MVYEELKKAVKEIKMSDEMKKQIISNSYSQIHNEEKAVMKKTNVRLKKKLPFVALLTVCVVSGAAVVANHLRGFKDVTKGTAVVSTVFEETTEMVKLETEVKNNLVVSAEFVEFNKPPYIEIDIMGISRYKIVDSSGKVVDEGSAKATSEFKNGKVTYELPLDSVESGEYKLIINEFVGSKKADQPLPIKGNWECSFVK